MWSDHSRCEVRARRRGLPAQMSGTVSTNPPHDTINFTGDLMRKIFHFDSPADPNVADAAVLCCFDVRVSQAVRKFLRRQGIERPDMIIIAGGAKTLASCASTVST
jgi:hypothetical protein